MKIRLRAVRERALMTQDELAERSGIAQTTISALELGKQQPRIKTVRALAEALGVDARELIVDEENETRGVN